jgi:hypothetical protein
MSSANVNDRATIEAIYPREAFESDAAQNSRGKAAVVHGLLIASEVAESGVFELKRAKRHAGENHPLGDTRFIAPFLREAYAVLEQTPAYGAPKEKAGGLEKVERRGDDYRTFIDQVIEMAARAQFKDPIGRHEERLRGFHGG